MYTDMIGYTALGQRDESLSLALLEEHRKLLRPVFSRHEGREIKTMGDAFLVEFPSALDAVRCAYDVQRTTREFNISMPEDRKLRVRIGVHLGDVVETQGDILGDAVNIASRVGPLAEEGGVCMTQQVRDQVKNKLELPLTSIGPRNLKNVSEPVEVYKVVMPWGQGAGGPVALDKRRVAVMPLVNMISDPNEEYFADGVTEELISAISKVRELEVISRTSVMQYKNTAKHVAEIGRELNVGTLLEGSVRKAGNRVRIAVQLIDTNSDKHLWAENYDRTLEDVFSIQSDIAQSVASALKVTLLEGDRQRLEKAPTKVPEAHALYLKGRSFELKVTEEGLKEAARFYQRAIDKDAEYALAYAYLAHANCLMGFFDIAPVVESFEKGKDLAKRALALDPSLPEAHGALGQAFMNQWDLKAAEAEFDRAIELDPSSAEVLNGKASLMFIRGDAGESARLARKALELDPLSPWTLQNAATWLLYSGHPDDAIALYTKVLEIDPEAAHARGNIGVAYVQKGMLDQGIAIIRESIKMQKGFRTGSISDLAYALGKAGRFDELRDLLAEAIEWHENNHRGSMALVSIYANLGEKDKAFEWLDKAFEEHSGYLLSVFSDFSFESLRFDRRMVEIRNRIGLT